MNWKTLTKTAKRTLSRNGSKILLGFGIAGAFTAVGFAITATPKAMILLDEKKKELGVEKLDAKTISAKASRCCRRPITSSAYMMKRKRTMVAQSRTRPQRLTAFPVTPST